MRNTGDIPFEQSFLAEHLDQLGAQPHRNAVGTPECGSAGPDELDQKQHTPSRDCDCSRDKDQRDDDAEQHCPNSSACPNQPVSTRLPESVCSVLVSTSQQAQRVVLVTRRYQADCG